MNWIKKLFKIPYNPILVWWVELVIRRGWFSNVGKIKPGHIVKYNLFAKILIPTVVKEGTFIVGGVWAKGENVEFTNGDGCDVFWIKVLGIHKHQWKFEYSTGDALDFERRARVYKCEDCGKFGVQHYGKKDFNIHVIDK